MSHPTTCDDSVRAPNLAARSEPGLVVILAAGLPKMTALALGHRGIEIGRANPPVLFADDDRMSRRHVRVSRADGRWRVEDLGSRNGTFVNGEPVASSDTLSGSVLVRVGKSLLWGVDDVVPFAGLRAPDSTDDGPVLGGTVRRAYAEIALAARAGDTLCIRGESGSGKELAARAFHEARWPSAHAPFVAVNCAAIPEGVAERLLFGARKGAYSGATADADGYLQAADGGTLFLDEIAELGPAIQAKLLRVLETREVLPLGASRPRAVTFAICAASHKRLSDEVVAGRFREDLYFRVGRPEVVLPPLRDRLDEIPAFIARALRSVDPEMSASVGFVEACCLRPWPGNVRELVAELQRAAHRALEQRAHVVDSAHLSPEAGFPLRSEPPRATSPPPHLEESPSKPAPAPRSDEDIRRALAENAGNVRGTARALGIHRNQLRRWLAKNGQGGTEPPKQD